MDDRDRPLRRLCEDGFVILPKVFQGDEIARIGDWLGIALERENDPSVLRSRGETYGSRNLLVTFPELPSLLNRPQLKDFLESVLGSDVGIVRALYFDKPPNRSWSLPWHRDRTIAVRRNDLPSAHFQKPTVKAGVSHVEAPEWLLKRMLTIRIHVDAMTSSNGPLHVIPGSHQEASEEKPPVEINTEAGDVLAMRPLLSHSSTMSQQGVASHRRVIHVELASERNLPDTFEWRWFVPL